MIWIPSPISIRVMARRWNTGKCRNGGNWAGQPREVGKGKMAAIRRKGQCTLRIRRLDYAYAMALTVG